MNEYLIRYKKDKQAQTVTIIAYDISMAINEMEMQYNIYEKDILSIIKLE